MWQSRSRIAEEEKEQPSATRYGFTEVTSPCRVVQPQALCFSTFLNHFGGLESYIWCKISLCKLTAEPLQVLPHKKGLVGSPVSEKQKESVSQIATFPQRGKRLQGPYSKQSPLTFLYRDLFAVRWSLWCLLSTMFLKAQDKTHRHTEEWIIFKH